MYIIKQDIAKLNKQIAHLQSHLKEQNKASAGGKQAIEHCSNVVVMLQSRLAAQTSTFKDVLELRTENMKATKDRREQFMFTTQQQSNAFSSMVYFEATLIWIRRHFMWRHDILTPFIFLVALGDSPLFNIDRRPASDSQPQTDVLSLNLSTPSQNLQQQEQVQLVDANNQYIESRSNAIESIESTLHELGGIFQQLAQMVSEQRDMVQRYKSFNLDFFFFVP